MAHGYAPTLDLENCFPPSHHHAAQSGRSLPKRFQHGDAIPDESAGNSRDASGSCAESFSVSHSETLLAECARRGDLAAFELLVAPYQQILFRVIFRITKNQEDAEDVTQEALLRAYTHLQQFQGNSKFSTWLVNIGVNQALMCLRGRRRQKMIFIDQSFQTEEDSISFELPESRPNPEQRYQNQELAGALLRAIHGLPATLRSAFILCYVRESSYEEAATALGISLSAVKSRSLRARRRLSERIVPKLGSQSKTGYAEEKSGVSMFEYTRHDVLDCTSL